MKSTFERAYSLLFLLSLFKYSAAIINRPPSTKNSSDKQQGSSYLSEQRPLWILQDQVPQSDYTEVIYTTQSPYHYRQQQTQSQAEQQRQLQQKQQPPQTAINLRSDGQLSLVTYRQPHPLNVQQQQLRPLLPARAPLFARQSPQRAMQLARTYSYSPRLPLPCHYMPLRSVRFQQRQQPQLPPRKRPRFIASNAVASTHRRAHYIPHISMPTFDSLPGDESVDEAPVFIYTGPKGKLILNTLLTAPKYPMQEPVPGQVLYPPSVPIFRPKPIVERFRMPGSTETLNLTLIPFYAHEAIDIRQAARMLDRGQQALEQEATTPQPTVLYAAPAAMSRIMDSETAESEPSPAKKFRSKKAKHYSAYHSPNEVQWTPMTAEQLKLVASTTTPYPLTAPSPPQNHRFSSELKDSPTTSSIFANYKVSYKSETDSVEDSQEKDELLINGDQLAINYIDDSLEKPVNSPTKSPTLSSRYSLSKEYYAFPVFTLGKLLKSETEETVKSLPTYMVENTVDRPLEQRQKAGGEQATATSAVGENIAEEHGDDDEDDVETWFILNSRYKGRHNYNNSEYRLSSKYIHTTDEREPNDSYLNL